MHCHLYYQPAQNFVFCNLTTITLGFAFNQPNFQLRLYPAESQ